ncbi:MAG: hypothetical protein HOE19_00740 [Candidatus Komeilibacteria bacterium]|jgi:hypothetical protein|nr:hypothetical protein [Candidatus Komeilibacteria bacterium]MBT4447343.1 hypothetical protein [Candidatus Komeilibacteria bacterium]
MGNADQKKIKDYLNSPDTDLLEIVYDQYDTPNADLAKWTLNYRLYDNMVKLNQTIFQSSKNTAKYNRYMFWLAILMAVITFSNLILIIASVAK